MQRLFEICDNTIQLNPRDILIDILFDKNVQAYIIDLNQQSQLFDNQQRADGTILPKYAPSTMQHKINRFGQFPERYVLYEDGIFFKSFNIVISDNDFTIAANPMRDGFNILEKFGNDVLGLTDDSIDKLIKQLLPIIIEQTNARILQ